MPRDDDHFDDDDRPRRPSRDEFEDDDRPPPRKKGTGLIIGILVGVFLVCCGGGGTAVYFVVRGAKKVVEQAAGTNQEAAETGQSQQNLLLIARAIQQHENATAAFPNNSYQSLPGQQPRPLLSWRVHLLPYLGEDALYKQFKLDESWDGPNNIKLLNRMPAVYGGPTVQKRSGLGKTFYRGFSAPGGIFEKPTNNGPTPKIKVTDIPDGTANTILVVDAGEGVEWTRPDDLDFSPGKPRPALGGAYPSLPFTLVLMADGTVHHLRKDVADETLRMLINRKDGLVLPPGWDQP